MHFKNRLLYVLPLAAAAVPLLILFRLGLVALYATPETDDFCLANHFNADGLAGTIATYYRTLMGRVVSLALITIPAAVSKSLDLDYFVVYPLVLITAMVVFVASSAFAARRLWAGLSAPESLLAGVAMSATIAVLAVSLREMFYWLSGSAPYMVPGTFVMIVLVEMVRSSANETEFSVRQVVVISTFCFLGALGNEFTPLWLCAFIVGSGLYWTAMLGRPQLRSHGAMLGATVVGLAILLLAPGNATRIGFYPGGQKIVESFVMAARFLWLDLGWLSDEWAARAWLIFSAVFAVFVAPPQPRGWRTALLLVGLTLIVLGSAYAAYVVAGFATGEDLATRARNQVVVLLVVGATCVVALAGRFIQPLRRYEILRIAGLVCCGVAGAQLLSGRALVAVNAERRQFGTFWIESMQRHALLRTTKDKDVVVPDRSAKPSVLMSADLTDNPTRLPNDCVAAFYGKRTVILRADPAMPEKAAK